MMTPTAKPRAQFCPVPKALYQTPAGRLCTLVGFHQGASGGTEAEMAYAVLGSRSASRVADGFVLAQGNWHLLRLVA